MQVYHVWIASSVRNYHPGFNSGSRLLDPVLPAEAYATRVLPAVVPRRFGLRRRLLRCGVRTRLSIVECGCSREFSGSQERQGSIQ